MITIVLFLVINSSFTLISRAETPHVVIDNGSLEFTTTDTTATSSTTWTTIGFHITRKESSIGDPTSVPYARIMLSKGMKFEDPQPSGITYVDFTIPEDIVSKALINAGLSGIKDNDTIYLHAIHQVMYGKTKGKVYYTKTGIMNAESWVNPNDFNDRFNIPVTYKANPAPVIKRYVTADGKQIGADEVLVSRKAGFPIDVIMKSTVNHGGETLYLSKSYVSYYANSTKRIVGTTNFVSSVNAKDYETQLINKQVKNRSHEQVPGGIIFVGVMRPKSKNPLPATSEEYYKEPELPDPYGVIAADERYNEEFDVTEGIPTTEDLYTNVFSNHYIFGFTLQRVSGTKSYPVTVKKTYNLSWEEEDPVTKKKVSKTATETVTQSITIKRDFSFWKITNLDYYGIDYATIKNYALPGGEVKLTPKNYTIPTLTYWHSAYQADHMIEPTYRSTITLPSASVSGKSSKPSIPNENFTSYAEEEVKEIRVKNDSFFFDGKEILNDSYLEEETESPKEINIDNDYVEDDVLYGSDLKIAFDKTNGEYPTTGSVTYKVVRSLSRSLGDSPTYPVNELNNVVIHTPTVCDATIESKIRNNQMLFPDTAIASLVLDTSFHINLSTEGEHRYIQGYEYRDYAKYIRSRQVKFPFDVYRGNVYIRAGTWIQLYEDITNYYLPIWVNEGKYTIEFRSESINADANNGLNKTETLANLNLSNYVATDTINVEVSGRIYGLNLYDISDYPIWEKVFRLPDSLKHTGFYYPVGTKDKNGIERGLNPTYTLPLIKGSHPTYLNVGTISTGYVTRFSLYTIGNMYGENDYIRITPRFYYVDSKGNNRQEIDVYYSETFNDKKHVLVKMGSDLDKLNKKSLRLGDTYRSVPSTEIATTARIKNVSEQVIKGTKRNVFTYTNMMIPESMRTFTGTNYTPTKTVPQGVDPDKVTVSKQRWYGEYYFPSEIHVLPQGFDLARYGLENYGFDFKESFWLKDGYVIVNFDIETIKNDKRHLGYINPDNSLKGYCNMWNMEGFQYSKIDYYKNTFNFIDGDYILYNTNNSAADDYISGGTH